MTTVYLIRHAEAEGNRYRRCHGHYDSTITDNGFGGHLCVHFLRDMAEAQKNDPNYGVNNQVTLRNTWKALTGETIN